MQDRPRQIPPVESFTEEEKEIINQVINTVSTSDDTKELEVCQEKLLVLQRENLNLKQNLQEVSQQLSEEKQTRIVVHKQMLDMYNKLKVLENENQFLQSAAAPSVATAQKSSKSESKHEVKDVPVKSELRQQPAPRVERRQPTFFCSDALLSSEEEFDRLCNRRSCGEVDSCRIL